MVADLTRHCQLGHRFKPFAKPSLFLNLNALLFEKLGLSLDKKLFYEILRSGLFLVFFVPTFIFFVLFFTPTVNGLRWKAVKKVALSNNESITFIYFSRGRTHEKKY